MTSQEIITDSEQTFIDDAQRDLVDLHAPLALKIARIACASNLNLNYDDAASSAYIGLLEAAIKYDPSHESGATFETLAIPIMRFRITDHIRAELGRHSEKASIFNTASTVSLDASPSHGDTLVTRYYAQDTDPESLMLEKELLVEVWQVAEECLAERELQILTLHFIEGTTMSKIGEQFGLTESRISQICTGAIQTIRKKIRAR
jgi:RNA polymerase sigma factor (sigma-70 family)